MKGQCDVISADTADALVSALNLTLVARQKQGFVLLTGRTQLFFFPGELKPFCAVLCTGKKAGIAAVFDYSLDSGKFVLGQLFNNTGFSQALQVGSTLYYFGAKTI